MEHRTDLPTLIAPVDDDTMHAMMETAFGPACRMESARLLEGGQYNTSYVIETRSPDQRVVLRIAPPPGKPLFRYEATMMTAEPWIYRRIAAAGVPTSHVLALDDTRAIVDRTWIVMAFIDAVPCSHATAPPDAKHALMAEAGRLTTRLHGIRGDMFGWPVGDGTLRGSSSWWEVYGEYLTETCVRSADAGVLSAGQCDAVLRKFAQHRPLFDACQTPVLVHNDIWAPNVLVQQRNGAWSVAALIDADRALFADREFEYGLWASEAGFKEGYGIPLDPSPEAVVRRAFYRFNLFCFGAWAYRVQIGKPDAQEYSQKAAMDFLKEVLAT